MLSLWRVRFCSNQLLGGKIKTRRTSGKIDASIWPASGAGKNAGKPVPHTFRLPMSSMNWSISPRPELKQGFLPALADAAATSWQDAPSPGVSTSPPPVLAVISSDFCDCRGSAASDDMANLVAVCWCCCCCEDLALVCPLADCVWMWRWMSWLRCWSIRLAKWCDVKFWPCADSKSDSDSPWLRPSVCDGEPWLLLSPNFAWLECFVAADAVAVHWKNMWVIQI